MNRTAAILIRLCVFCLCLKLSASIEDGLIGYWPLDGDALDASGNGNNGTVLTGAGFVENPTGEGLVLQSQGGTVNYGHTQVSLPGVHPGNNQYGYEASGSLWVRFDDRIHMGEWTDVQGVLGHMPGVLYIERVMSSNRLRTMIHVKNSDGSIVNTWPASAPNSIGEENKWYHVAWTFRACDEDAANGFFRWYINGYLSAERTGNLLTLSTSLFKIGASHGGYANNTKIGEVRLYDRILSDAEILELARWEGFSPIAHYPSWWEQYGVIDPNAPANDYAPVNQGQLKHVATQAAAYMDDALDALGGAGTDVHALVDAWTTPGDLADDYAVTNLGQLKYVASAFYNRLRELNFTGWPEGMSIDASTGYPWTTVVNDDVDFAPANQGQLKFLVSWSFSEWLNGDGDNNGIPDWLQDYLAGLYDWDAYVTAADIQPDGDFDGDGLTNAEELADTGLIADYYNGDVGNYSISIQTEGMIVGESGKLAPGAITILVRDVQNNPVANAPIHLSPQTLSALLTTDPQGGGLRSPLVVTTDANGVATIYVQP